MKKDLGHSYDEPIGLATPSKKYYPSTRLESEDALNIPNSMIDKDFEVKCTVRICRKENITDKKGTKQTLELEFRKIDFGTKLDKDLQEDITDAIEGIKESKNEEEAEDRMVE